MRSFIAWRHWYPLSIRETSFTRLVGSSNLSSPLIFLRFWRELAYFERKVGYVNPKIWRVKIGIPYTENRIRRRVTGKNKICYDSHKALLYDSWDSLSNSYNLSISCVFVHVFVFFRGVNVQWIQYFYWVDLLQKSFEFKIVEWGDQVET